MTSSVGVDIGNLDNCIDDIRSAMASDVSCPDFNVYVKNYDKLLADLKEAIKVLPKVYQDSLGLPFIQFLTQMGEGEFNKIFTSRYITRDEEFYKEIIPDVVLALLLHSQRYAEGSSNALQELISDLYDSFLSEEDRVGKQTGSPINPPDLETLAPLIKWGNPDNGPYTWPANATGSMDAKIKVAVVNLPQMFTKQGVLAWSSLGHETGGHDILHADVGMLQELAGKVRAAITPKFGAQQANLWASWIDEAASDVLGLLHLGPAAGIGLIGFFRGLSQDGRLRSVGSSSDPHPIDVLRGFMAAEVVRNLNFGQAAEWAQIIENESAKDLGRYVYIKNYQTGRSQAIDAKVAVQAAKLAGVTIANSKLHALENHSLHDIQDWTDNDQRIADDLAKALSGTGALPSRYEGGGFYAAHVVSAAVTEALKEGSDVQKIFNSMIKLLDEMHVGNPTWQPGSVASRSPRERRIVYGHLVASA